jgi:hypothetical protein
MAALVAKLEKWYLTEIWVLDHVKHVFLLILRLYFGWGASRGIPTRVNGVRARAGESRLALMGRVDLGGYPPRSPTDPDLPVEEASGSSRCGAVPRTIHCLTVTRWEVRCPRRGSGVGSTTRHPLRSTGSGRARSPASSLLWGAPTPCRPSRRTSLPSFGDSRVGKGRPAGSRASGFPFPL